MPLEQNFNQLDLPAFKLRALLARMFEVNSTFVLIVLAVAAASACVCACLVAEISRRFVPRNTNYANALKLLLADIVLAKVTEPLLPAPGSSAGRRPVRTHLFFAKKCRLPRFVLCTGTTMRLSSSSQCVGPSCLVWSLVPFPECVFCNRTHTLTLTRSRAY